jgi:hypothetical protein
MAPQAAFAISVAGRVFNVGTDFLEEERIAGMAGVFVEFRAGIRVAATGKQFYIGGLTPSFSATIFSAMRSPSSSLSTNITVWAPGCNRLGSAGVKATTGMVGLISISVELTVPVTLLL